MQYVRCLSVRCFNYANGVIWDGGIWDMRCDETGKANLVEMNCLRNLAKVTIMVRVRNEELRIRAVIENELVTKVHQRVLRWIYSFGEWMSTVWLEEC